MKRKNKKVNLKNKLVKYQNILNTVPLRGMNTRLVDIFFSVVAESRNIDKNELRIPLTRLLQLCGDDYNGHIQNFVRDVHKTSRQLFKISAYEDTPDYFKEGVLFPTIKADKKTNTVFIRINPDMRGILNDFSREFTRFSLRQFTSLSSTYAKTAFRLIKQFRTSGHLYLTNKQFRRDLCIPKSYSNATISKRILKQIIIELTPYIKDLHVRKIRKGYGGRIRAYEFLFRPESRKADDFSHGSKYDAQWMYNNIKLNQFVSPRLKDEMYRRVNKFIARKHRLRTHRKPKEVNVFQTSDVNHMIKNASAYDLRAELKINSGRNAPKRFTQYQRRKIRKVIHEKDHESRDR